MRFVVSVRAQAVTATLLGYSGRLIERLKRALDRLSLEVQGAVKGRKLTGQVLHVRTGTLRRSINRRVVYSGGGIIEAVVGTNVEYAAVHEYGFRGEVNVKAHLRTIKQAWGRPISPREVAVGAHTRRVDLPERSFLRSTLHEFEARAKAAIERAAVEALSP